MKQKSVIIKEKLLVLIILLILVIFFVIQFTNLRIHTQSFRFGDESEHLTPAWMMHKYGTRLYEDLSTNHQPLPILTSLAFFKVVKYPNLFMFIERLRQFMIVVSFLGALLLIYKFHFAGLLSVILIETVKFYLFGYHILAESFALYPTMFIVGIIARHLFFTTLQIPKTTQIIENTLFGLSVFWIAFSLLPSWPFLVISSIFYFFLQNSRGRKITLLSIFLPVIILFLFIDANGWFRDTITANVKYFIPYEAEIKDFNANFALIIYPFLSFFYAHGPIAKYLILINLILISSAGVILFETKKKSVFILKFFIAYGLIVLLNLRISSVNIGFYTAFHILPQLGAYTILAVLLLMTALKTVGKKTSKKAALLFTSSAFILAALFFNTDWWRENKDVMNEHFIQYGEIQSLGSALKILRYDGDTFLVGQLEGLLNITADIPVAGKQNAYLGWSYRSKRAVENLKTVMNNNPPTFIYFTEGGPFFGLLKPYLMSDYTRLQRFDGGNTYAYMLNSEMNKRTQIQWQEFENLFYKIPEQTQF